MRGSPLAGRTRRTGSRKRRGWFKSDGTKIADNLDDLISGSINAAIDLDEFGNTVDHEVWTGTSPQGIAIANAQCDDWTSGSGTLAGIFGSSSAADTGWTGEETASCLASQGLYCFQR